MNNKRVLVTGAARGIGKGITARFLAEGARVIFLDKNKADLKEAIAELDPVKKGQTEQLVCDLNDDEEMQSAADWAWNRWGGLDILVNNAGIAVRESFLDIPQANWDRVMDVNVRAVFMLSQRIAKEMVEAHVSGAIVNMCSKNGLAGSSKLAHYNTSKAGIHLLTQSMAVELAEHGIRVNAVAPGFIETPLDRELKQKEKDLKLTERTPMKRLGTVEEVANAVFFLASSEASYITGTTLVVDGGHLANASEI